MTATEVMTAPETPLEAFALVTAAMLRLSNLLRTAPAFGAAPTILTALLLSTRTVALISFPETTSAALRRTDLLSQGHPKALFLNIASDIYVLNFHEPARLPPFVDGST